MLTSSYSFTKHKAVSQTSVDRRRLEVSEARRLKALEDENARLKRLLAEAMLDNAMLKDVASKKW
jgi:putative transposase